MKKLIIHTVTGIVMLSCGQLSLGCSSNNDPEIATPINRVDIALDSKSKATAETLKDTYTRFTTAAVDAVDNGEVELTNKNVIVSPLSMTLVLSMFANGIEEESKNVIAGYLGVDDINAVNYLSKTLLEELPKVDNLTKLMFANSAWIDTPITLTPDYISIIEDIYGATYHYEDLQTKTTVNKINNWCSEKTNGLVPEMVFDIPRENIFAMFFNAMYFQGKWNEKLEFKSGDTKEQIFHGSEGDSRVEMMHAHDFVGYYYQDDNFEICRLPFGNKAFNMDIILPETNLSLSDANYLLSSFLIMEKESVQKEYSIDLSIPKFELENYMPMNEILVSCGLGKIVDESHKFTMFNEDMEGSVKTYQRSAFKIDESGVTAAAVSQITGGYTFAGKEHKNFTVDRPFYFFINEVSTGACILSGRIADL